MDASRCSAVEALELMMKLRFGTRRTEANDFLWTIDCDGMRLGRLFLEIIFDGLTKAVQQDFVEFLNAGGFAAWH